jgi:hypothetical protein
MATADCTQTQNPIVKNIPIRKSGAEMEVCHGKVKLRAGSLIKLKRYMQIAKACLA